MTDRKDIPHLLQLLDDDSEEIQENVRAALKSFGCMLEKEVHPFLEDLNPIQRECVDKLGMELRLRSFQEGWLNWIDMVDEKEALEYALSRLAFLDFGYFESPLEDLLDELADEFLQTEREACADSLMDFLFREKGLGAPTDDYYNPLNSNLVHVIRKGKGIQISLSSIAMLTGRRLGIHLYGLNLPGHFMVISMEPDNIRVFDCFNKGRPLPKQTSWYLEQSLRLTSSSIIKLKAKTPEIILRVLRNLMNASFRKADKEKHRFYSDLFDQLIRRMEDNPGT